MHYFLIYLHSCITSNVLMQDGAGLTTAQEAASSFALQQLCHLLYSRQSHDKKKCPIPYRKLMYSVGSTAVAIAHSFQQLLDHN
jgi:hypothetical protein